MTQHQQLLVNRFFRSFPKLILQSVLSSVGLVPSYHSTFLGPKFFRVSISWVQNFFSWIFSREYFVGPKFSLVGVSWVQVFFRGNFVSPKFSLVGVLWAQIFSRRYFVGSKFPCGYFVRNSEYITTKRLSIFINCLIFNINAYVNDV